MLCELQISTKRAVSHERELFLKSANQKPRKSSVKQTVRFDLWYKLERKRADSKHTRTHTHTHTQDDYCNSHACAER